MEQVKCECGHVNPHGTLLCEACGKELAGDSGQPLLDMRYEGSARRSQTYNKTIVDKIWNFFSSVKVGIALIVITLVASAIGTILPQEKNITLTVPAETFYAENYGWFGRLYYFLGFHDLYGSPWYLLLVASVGVSLVICSLDRAVPMYKALKQQKVTRHTGFMKKQRFFAKADIPDFNFKGEIETVKEHLKKRRYRIYEEKGNLLAEKGRFSRWGPYVNHIGLIIFLLGVMLRSLPGFYVDEQLWLKEGETKPIPGTDKQYYLTNNQFILELYDESDGEVYREALEKQGAIVKNFQSNVTLYKAPKTLPGEKPELQKVRDGEIRVNEPLKFEQFALYQSTYKLNEIKTMDFALTNKATGEEFGTISIDLDSPQKRYDLQGGYYVEIIAYFPDFELKDGEPVTKSPNPNNPAFAFKMVTPDHPEGETSFTSIMQTIEPLGENEYKMAFQKMETANYTGLTVRKDSTLWLIALGGIIFLIGVAQGSFWQHRRIWMKVENNEVFIAAHTNKGWYSLSNELKKIFESTKLPVPMDQLHREDEGNGKQGVDVNG